MAFVISIKNVQNASNAFVAFQMWTESGQAENSALGCGLIMAKVWQSDLDHRHHFIVEVHLLEEVVSVTSIRLLLMRYQVDHTIMTLMVIFPKLENVAICCTYSFFLSFMDV